MNATEGARTRVKRSLEKQLYNGDNPDPARPIASKGPLVASNAPTA